MQSVEWGEGHILQFVETKMFIVYNMTAILVKLGLQVVYYMAFRVECVKLVKYGVGESVQS